MSERTYDVLIIGGGILGCFCARELSAFDISVGLLEAREDICTGISAANSAIIYCGHDTFPGTLKAECCVAANKDFGRLCDKLGVEFKRCGSILAAYGENGLGAIKEKYENGRLMGVEGLEIISGNEVRSLEGALTRDIKYGLLAKNTGTVMPWELCIAAAANAVKNGAEFMFNEDVKSVAFSGGVYTVETERNTYTSKSLINCAGLRSVGINEMLGIRGISIVPRVGDYLLLDKNVSDIVSRVIFEEREDHKKGITLVPTVKGALMIGPSNRRSKNKKPFDGGYEDKSYTSYDELEKLKTNVKRLVPDIKLDIIRNFSTVRHSMYKSYVNETGETVLTDEKAQTFKLFKDDRYPGYIGLVGIRTPGLTCSPELAKRVAEDAAAFLNAGIKSDFDPVQEPLIKPADTAGDERNAGDPDEYDMVCLCEGISKADILRAIRMKPGAVTLDGVKKRSGAMLGRCQGSRCTDRLMEIMAEELKTRVSEIMKDGSGSWVIRGQNNERR